MQRIQRVVVGDEQEDSISPFGQRPQRADHADVIAEMQVPGRLNACQYYACDVPLLRRLCHRYEPLPLSSAG